jgi:hypothetical protein
MVIGQWSLVFFVSWKPDPYNGAFLSVGMGPKKQEYVVFGVKLFRLQIFFLGLDNLDKVNLQLKQK